MPSVLFVPRICVPLLSGEFSLISIGDPKQTDEFAKTHPDRLRLEFHDTDKEIGEGYEHFTYFMAMKIISWLESRQDQDIVVHCEGGISRSAAVAKYLIENAGYAQKTFELCSDSMDGYNSLVFHQLRVAQMDRKEAVRRCINTAKHLDHKTRP